MTCSYGAFRGFTPRGGSVTFHSSTVKGRPRCMGRLFSASSGDAWTDRVNTPERTVSGKFGGVPKRSNGTDCKSVGYAFGGSNPPPTTASPLAEGK
jgi:hypothetical protein